MSLTVVVHTPFHPWWYGGFPFSRCFFGKAAKPFSKCLKRCWSPWHFGTGFVQPRKAKVSVSGGCPTRLEKLNGPGPKQPLSWQHHLKISRILSNSAECWENCRKCLASQSHCLRLQSACSTLQLRSRSFILFLAAFSAAVFLWSWFAFSTFGPQRAFSRQLSSENLDQIKKPVPSRRFAGQIFPNRSNLLKHWVAVNCLQPHIFSGWPLWMSFFFHPQKHCHSNF